MAKFPPDRFDRIHDDVDRVGAHRVAPSRGRGWIIAAWVAGAAAVLIIGGVVALFVMDSRVAFRPAPVAPTSEQPTPAPGPGRSTPTPTVPPVQPTVAPQTEIAVLNGTAVSGLASRAVRLLASGGWTGDVTAGNADVEDRKATVVYYPDASLEGAALGVVRSLGVGSAQLTPAGEIPGAGNAGVLDGLTVVLGSDFDAAHRG